VQQVGKLVVAGYGEANTPVDGSFKQAVDRHSTSKMDVLFNDPFLGKG